MSKTILITGATDGIGLEAAKLLAASGHQVLLHGRNPAKLERAKEAVRGVCPNATFETFLADLANLNEVERLAEAVGAAHPRLDVLLNNAGVLRTAQATASDGRDIRFVVNTIAPYLLTRRLLPKIPANGRVVNLSSAAQAPVDLAGLRGPVHLDPMDAYSQSKLAITMWSQHLAKTIGPDGPVVVSVNPGSLLATKMVKEGFGMAGNDIGIGARILVEAAVGDRFADATGKYFDNDAGRFAPPHAAGRGDDACQRLVAVLDEMMTVNS